MKFNSNNKNIELKYLPLNVQILHWCIDNYEISKCIVSQSAILCGKFEIYDADFKRKGSQNKNLFMKV